MARLEWGKALSAEEWMPLEKPEDFWRRRQHSLASIPAGEVLLGRDRTSGELASVTPKELSTHMHVLGATGTGKSFFLEGMFESLILQGHGGCFIDPHGESYHRMLGYLATLNRLRPQLRLSERVIPFDPSDTQNLLSFNPIARNAKVFDYQVTTLMEGMRKCWKAPNFTDTPRLARWLFNTTHALIESEVGLVQGWEMVKPYPSPLRQAITQRIKNRLVREEWEWLDGNRPKDQGELVESTLNRFKPFSVNEVLRGIFGPRGNTLDVPAVIDEGKILLVNLSSKNTLTPAQRDLLGTLLVSEMLTAAFSRPPEKRRPFFLFLDEFQNFVTTDMCEILDGGRKFGLHAVLAHQNLQQLKQDDPQVYYSVMTNARIKAVFGGLTEDDLVSVGREVHLLDPFRVKRENWHQIVTPVESTRVVVTETESSGSNWTTNIGTVNNLGFVNQTSYIDGSGFFGGGGETSRSRASSSQSGTQHSEASGGNDARSRAESRVPFIEPHVSQELASVEFMNLEEQLYEKNRMLKRQRVQEFGALVPGRELMLLEAPTLTTKLQPTASELSEFKQACVENAGCFRTMQEAERQIGELEQKLLNEPEPAISVRAIEGKTDAAASPAQNPRSQKQGTVWDKEREVVGRDGSAKKPK